MEYTFYALFSWTKLIQLFVIDQIRVIHQITQKFELFVDIY